MSETEDDAAAGCESCVFYVAAQTEIAANREANRNATRTVARAEDANIPMRRSSGLCSLTEDLELQRLICDAKGSPAGCKIALYCLSRLIEYKQREALYGRGS